MVPSTYRCSVSPHCMNGSGSLSGTMTELRAHGCDSWGYHLNHHKHSKNVEEDGAETQPSFYCRHAAKLWKLVQEIYGAASADQAHLELKGFEWLDLSDPLVTHKIVLPWYDKTSEHTTLKLLGVGVIGMLWIGPRKEQSWDSQWTCEQVTGNCASHSLNGFPECKNQSFPRSQFLKVTNFYKICHPFTVCLPMRHSPQGQGWIIKHLSHWHCSHFHQQNARAESKICPTQSQYPWHSEDESQA